MLKGIPLLFAISLARASCPEHRRGAGDFVRALESARGLPLAGAGHRFDTLIFKSPAKGGKERLAVLSLRLAQIEKSSTNTRTRRGETKTVSPGLMASSANCSRLISTLSTALDSSA